MRALPDFLGIVFGFGFARRFFPALGIPLLFPQLGVQGQIGVCGTAMSAGTGPAILLGRVYHARANRIQFGIAQSSPQVRQIQRARVKTSLQMT